MNYLVCLFLLEILIDFSCEQNGNYCDMDKDCDTCVICGKNTNNYCACNFYNVYCRNSKLNAYTILSDFLFSYDGCLKNNYENEDICGDSNQSIDIGIYNQITFKSTSQRNFVCFYNIKKIKNNNNDINILLTKDSDEPINFNIHLVIYYNYDKIKISSRINCLSSSNHLEIIESEAERISMYVDIPDGKNMDKISIIFGMDNTEEKIISKKKSKNVNDIVIYGSILGIFCVFLIVFIICLYKKCKKVKNLNLNKDNQIKTITQTQTQNQSQTEIRPEISKISMIKNNKVKIDDMFKGELKPKIFKKLKNGSNDNDCLNCTICLEKFKEGLSLIVDTKCQHRFHYKCFKNWIYKNILVPKCPNCNLPILDTENKNNLSNNISSINPCNPHSSFNVTTITNFSS